MARKVSFFREVIKNEAHKKSTSIGDSSRSSPKNKHKKRGWKRYRGQGK